MFSLGKHAICWDKKLEESFLVARLLLTRAEGGVSIQIVASCILSRLLFQNLVLLPFLLSRAIYIDAIIGHFCFLYLFSSFFVTFSFFFEGHLRQRCTPSMGTPLDVSRQQRKDSFRFTGGGGGG